MATAVCMRALPASIQRTAAATTGVRRHSARPATALTQPTLTFTWKPTRSVRGQSARSLPSSRWLQKGRKPPGHTHSSDWWLTKIGNARPATHRPSSSSSWRHAATDDHAGETSPAATHGHRPCVSRVIALNLSPGRTSAAVTRPVLLILQRVEDVEASGAVACALLDPLRVSSSEASGAKTVLGGRYRLLRRLGSGGMATVWMARDERLGPDVAVKVLSDVLAGDERYARRFKREARVAAGLNHPGLVPVLDFGAESDAHIWSWSWFGATRSRDGSPLGRPANLT